MRTQKLRRPPRRLHPCLNPTHCRSVQNVVGWEALLHERVLLIEDEPHIVEALSFLLTREGMSVSAHANGTDAAETTARLAPDLVILDVMLPGKSGFDILHEIRQIHGMTELPVLMLTAKGQSRDRAAAQAAGASLFMTKPFSNREIVANVKSLLE